VWDVQRLCGYETICQVYLLFHVVCTVHCIIIIRYKPTKCTFSKLILQYLISWCLLHVSKPRVHLQKVGYIYRYGTCFTCVSTRSLVGRRKRSILIIWPSYVELLSQRHTTGRKLLCWPDKGPFVIILGKLLWTVGDFRDKWMMRTVSDADRGQLARKISSSPTWTTKTFRVGEPDSENSGSGQEILRFYGTRRFIIVFSRAHPLDLLQRKLLTSSPHLGLGPHPSGCLFISFLFSDVISKSNLEASNGRVVGR
jgi:hypothetical protein